MPPRRSTPAQAAIQNVVGDRIRRLRTELGFSQEHLAHRSGVHRTFVGHIERGEVNPTLSSLCLLANGLEVDVAELVQGVNDQKPAFASQSTNELPASPRPR